MMRQMCTLYSVQSYFKWDNKEGWGHGYAPTSENMETCEIRCNSLRCEVVLGNALCKLY